MRAKRASSQLRRKPKQERSRERVDAILKTAMQLIGEKGIDAVTMKEVASRAGGPLASVYQYFPNKSAILATLYERFSETSREQLTAIVAGVSDLASLIEASDRLLDNYHGRVAGDPAIQDLQNAIQADKALQNLDITETRRQARLFYDASSPPRCAGAPRGVWTHGLPDLPAGRRRRAPGADTGRRRGPANARGLQVDRSWAVAAVRR